jgi:hypothetical protein
MQHTPLVSSGLHIEIHLLPDDPLQGLERYASVLPLT